MSRTIPALGAALLGLFMMLRTPAVAAALAATTATTATTKTGNANATETASAEATANAPSSNVMPPSEPPTEAFPVATAPAAQTASPIVPAPVPAPADQTAHAAAAPVAPAPSPTIPATEAAQALERARAAYEYGDMDMVVDSARLVAEGRLRPTPTQRAQALRFLGIGLFLTGRPEGAETAFFDLLRQRPATKLDPTNTRPDVVAFFENVRARHTDEIRQAARNRPGKSLLLSFLPPLGQFQNGNPGRGWTIAALELISTGVAIGTYAQLKSWVNPRDQTFGPHTDDARTLRILNNVAIGVLVGTIAVAIIDGVANFGRDPDDHPLAWAGPGGVGFRF
jgi:hypothetical protein